jgi:signal transduction histidine kinase/ActR/RegA family two-component response regulator
VWDDLADAVAIPGGVGFAGRLVARIAPLLAADLAFVGLLDSQGRRVRTIAAWADGAPGDDFEYDLHDTPCAEVLHSPICIHSEGVQARFPADRLLAQMRVEGYAGVPIHDEHGIAIGLLVVLWRAPVLRPAFVSTALRIFGARAGAELARGQAEARAEQRARQLLRQTEALTRFSRSPAWSEGDRAQLFAELTELGCDTLEVERLSVWLYDAMRGRMDLADLYRRSLDRHAEGEVLERRAHAAYFDALDRDRVVVAEDVEADPRMRELLAGYLHPAGVRSRLDAPIRVRGRVVGVVCCGHVGEPRAWTPEDRSFAGSLADLAAAVVEQAERRALEGQLQHAQRMDSIGRLAGGMAHDFNNLLTAIEMSKELALGSIPADAEAVEFLEEIAGAVGRASELTDGLLTFARQRPIQPADIDLDAALGRMQRMLVRMLGEDVELQTRPGAPGGHVRLDPGQLEQIVVNLVVNARDAIGARGHIVVETRRLAVPAAGAPGHPSLAPGPWLVVSVTDDGCGFAAELVPHLFEPFFTTKDQGRGTGLGLATVYAIVTAAGGAIDASGRPGEGAVFRVYLPEVEGGARETVVEPEAQERAGGDETILLVEDDDAVRRVVARGLERRGYRVLSAASGRDALATAQSDAGPIALVISDVVMPDMTGRALWVTLSERLPGAKALFVSGYTQDVAVHHELLEAGTAFLSKPLTMQVLARKVRTLLDARNHSG